MLWRHPETAARINTGMRVSASGELRDGEPGSPGSPAERHCHDLGYQVTRGVSGEEPFVTSADLLGIVTIGKLAEHRFMRQRVCMSQAAIRNSALLAGEDFKVRLTVGSALFFFIGAARPVLPRLLEGASCTRKEHSWPVPGLGSGRRASIRRCCRRGAVLPLDRSGAFQLHSALAAS